MSDKVKLNKNPFDLAKAARTLLWIAMAALVGIVTVGGDVDWENVGPAGLTWSGVVVAAWAVIRIGLGWLRKSVPADQQVGILGVLRLFTVLAVASVVLAGCVSFPGMENMLQSRDTLKIKEPDFKLTIKGSGDGVFARDVHYQGEGENPWILTVAATADITSPALLRSFDSLDAAVQQIPVLAQVFGSMPENPQERVTWVARLFSFLGTNPGLIPDLLGLLLGG